MSPRYVTQILPGTALSGTQTQLLGSLAFPSAGGVQAVDLDGTVHDLIGSSGAMTLTVIDTDSAAASVGLDVRHRLSSGTPAAGMGSAITFSAQTSAGGVGTPIGAEIAMVYSDVTSGAQFAGLSFSLRVNGTVTEALGLSATATTRTLAVAGSGNVSLRILPLGTGGFAVRNSGDTATIFGVQSVASGNFAPVLWGSNESATPGAATINRPSGQVAVAIGQSSVTVTNDLVTATSIVIATLQFVDATFTQILSVVPGAGSFVITGNGNATAATKIGFIVINPSA